MKELALLVEVILLTNNLKMMFNLLSKLVYFSYFQVTNKKYIFIYAKSQIFQTIIVNILASNYTIVETIIANQRRLRSLRGFCLYILSLEETGKIFKF
jgi:hypothetical protein